MKRILLPLITLSLLLQAFPSFGQIKQEGWWIMDRVELINKSDCEDFTYSGTSVTYRNPKTWSYVANGRGEDGKLHTVSDVISIMIDWTAPPAHIQCGKEGDISMNYSMTARPDTYENKNFRRMRPTPFYSMEMRLQLVQKGKSSDDPFTPEWNYSAPKDNEWGHASGQFQLRNEPAGYYFTGVDVSKGNYELLLRIWVDIAGDDLYKWDEGKVYSHGYVLVHHYHYSRDMFDSMANPRTEDKSTTSDDGFSSVDDLSTDDQLEYLQGLLERTQEEREREKSKGSKANANKLKELNKSIAQLKREIAKLQ